MSRDAPSPIISASEIGQFIYCRRAWWLARVAGIAPANEDALEAGSRSHRRHGRAVRSAAALRRLALALLAGGALAGAVWMASLLLRVTP